MVMGLPSDEMTAVGLRSNSRSLIEEEIGSQFLFLVNTEKRVKVECEVVKLKQKKLYADNCSKTEFSE